MLKYFLIGIFLLLLFSVTACSRISGVNYGCSMESRKMCETQMSETVWPSYYCTFLINEDCSE